MTKKAGCPVNGCTEYDVDLNWWATDPLSRIRFKIKVSIEGGHFYWTNHVTISFNHFCYAAVFDASSIPSETQYSKVEFSTALFTSTPSAC